MPPHAVVPAILTKAPFTLAEARAAGLTSRQLQGGSWRRLGRGLYVRTDRDPEPLDLLAAVHRRFPPVAAFAGRTAGWLHGLDLPPCDPIEIAVPRSCGISTRSGVLVRRHDLIETDITLRRGLRVTSSVRTLADLTRSHDVVESIVILDMALHAGLVMVGELMQTPRLRRFANWVEAAAESPMESRLRIQLVRAGLPRPIAQAVLKDEAGRPLARVDLYYPSARLVIEYDGGTHRDSLVQDNRRQKRLLQAGYRLLRFTAADVLGSPDAVAARVSAALAMR